MAAGFVIWTAVSLVLLVIGIAAWKADNAVAFFTGTKPPEVSDVKKYNHSIAGLWFVYAVLFELLGVPFLYAKHNAADFLWAIAGVPVITIGLMLAYNRILRRYERKK